MMAYLRQLGTLGLGLALAVQASADGRFSGGACISQGSWLQAALNQTDIVSNAINTLRKDPNCTALITAVEQAPKYAGKNGGPEVSDAETTSYANTYRELKAISDYLKPSRLGNGMGNQAFRDIVFHVVFNKSYDSIKDIHNQTDLSKLTDAQKEDIKNVSLRLKSFLKKSQDVANMTMSTSKVILSALPASEMCMHNNPSTTAAIFGAIAHSTAALMTGGHVNGVGEMVGSLMQYTREMKYIKSLAPLELARFQASVSCLVESTSESYCSIQDAEDSLDFLKEGHELTQKKQKVSDIIANAGKDPIANPVGGLMIFTRDVPVMQAWMQKILFGINPKLSIEAQMKNTYWDSYTNFLKANNSLLGGFQDKEQFYIENTTGKDYNTKIGQVKKIYNEVIGHTGSGSKFPVGGADEWNFFTNAMQAEMIHFYLLGYEVMPPEFLEIQRNISGFSNQFEAWWNRMQSERTGAFANPDDMIGLIRNRLASLMDKAQIEANGFFAKRLVVDPQNLLSEAMTIKGPGVGGVTPLQAFTNLKTYYGNLAQKLRASSQKLMASNDADTQLRGEQLQAQIPMLENSIARIDKIIGALKSIAKFKSNDIHSAKTQSEEVMGIIYEAAYMLVARDSFFGTRMQTALQADLSDTLWRREGLTDRQLEYFLAIAPDIVAKLAGFYSSNPVNQRTDVSSAKMIHLANLKSVEQLFAKVVFSQILTLDCQLYGGKFCTYKDKEIDPAGAQASSGWFSGALDVAQVNKDLAGEIEKMKSPAAASGPADCRVGAVTEANKNLKPCWPKTPSDHKTISDARARQMYLPTEDSRSHEHLRAKLCIQALAFESRAQFKSICAGARLVSEFSDSKDAFKLNMDFNEQLVSISQSSEARKIDAARSEGVCSFRSYLRKNHVYYMYREYLKAD